MTGSKLVTWWRDAILGHHAAPLAVDRDLRGHDVGAHVAAVVDERGRRLVARRLDPEHEHQPLPSASISGAR
jgi:hypothetical protein